MGIVRLRWQRVTDPEVLRQVARSRYVK